MKSYFFHESGWDHGGGLEWVLLSDDDTCWSDYTCAHCYLIPVWVSCSDEVNLAELIFEYIFRAFK